MGVRITFPKGVLQCLDEAAVLKRQAFPTNEELQQSETSDPALSYLGASLVPLCVHYRYTDKYLATEERQEGFLGLVL